MPFYEYKCIKCDFKFEELQAINDTNFPKCPKCLGEVKKLVSTITTNVIRNAKESLETIREEAKRDARDILNGDVEKASDYLGEQGVLDLFKNG